MTCSHSLFVAKLRGLVWALRLRPSPSALAIPAFGAAGIALIPQWTRSVGTHALTMVIGLWLFVLFAGALFTTREVRSEQSLDAWGGTVLSRALRATWTIWAGLALAHALFWMSQYRLNHHVLLPVALLLLTRFFDREGQVVTAALVTLVLVATRSPEFVQVTALMAAVAFSLHAFRKPVVPAENDATLLRDEYRAASVDAPPRRQLIFTRLPQPQFARHLAWAGYSLYFAAWTFAWTGGELPLHVAALDLGLAPIVAWFVWRTRSRVITLPLVTTYLDWSIQSRLLRAPQSTLQWGLTTFSAGFLLLLASVFTSWRYERRARR